MRRTKLTTLETLLINQIANSFRVPMLVDNNIPKLWIHFPQKNLELKTFFHVHEIRLLPKVLLHKNVNKIGVRSMSWFFEFGLDLFDSN